MRGKVTKSKFLRPNVSIVYKAGRANNQFTIPVPKDTSSAWVSLNPASRKI